MLWKKVIIYDKRVIWESIIYIYYFFCARIRTEAFLYFRFFFFSSMFIMVWLMNFNYDNKKKTQIGCVFFSCGIIFVVLLSNYSNDLQVLNDHLQSLLLNFQLSNANKHLAFVDGNVRKLCKRFISEHSKSSTSIFQLICYYIDDPTIQIKFLCSEFKKIKICSNK